MVLYEFNALTRDKQAEAVWAYGVHLKERWEDGYHVILYQLPHFYVEAYFNEEEDEIEKYRSFISTEQLQPYLKDIDLTHLL